MQIPGPQFRDLFTTGGRRPVYPRGVADAAPHITIEPEDLKTVNPKNPVVSPVEFTRFHYTEAVDGAADHIAFEEIGVAGHDGQTWRCTVWRPPGTEGADVIVRATAMAMQLLSECPGGPYVII